MALKVRSSVRRFLAGHQSIHQSVQSVFTGVIGVDVGAQHGSVSQHSGLVHGDANNRQFVDIPGNFTAALAEAEGRMATANIKEGNNQVLTGNELRDSILTSKVQVHIELTASFDLLHHLVVL